MHLLCLLLTGCCTGQITLHALLIAATVPLMQLLRAGPDSPLARQPLWCRPGIVDRGLVGEFRREARVVRKGMEGDLIKVRLCVCAAYDAGGMLTSGSSDSSESVE